MGFIGYSKNVKVLKLFKKKKERSILVNTQKLYFS